MGDLLTAVPGKSSCVLVCVFDLCLDLLTVSNGPVSTLLLRKILDIDILFLHVINILNHTFAACTLNVFKFIFTFLPLCSVVQE